MNDLKNDINKTEDKNEQKNEINKENYHFNNNFEIDIVSKYNFDYTTKLNSMNQYLNPISKQKLLNQIFLISSNLNMLNKMISIEKLH